MGNDRNIFNQTSASAERAGRADSGTTLRRFRDEVSCVIGGWERGRALVAASLEVASDAVASQALSAEAEADVEKTRRSRPRRCPFMPVTVLISE